MQPPLDEPIRPIDQTVLELLRRSSALSGGKEGQVSENGVVHQGMTVTELIEELQVTATAVRQRLERLVEMELVQRNKESVGRGRPLYRYCLTTTGMRYAAASYGDLATALWQEVMELPNPQQRTRLLRRVARRMGDGLKESVPDSDDIAVRLAATAAALGRRKMTVAVNDSDPLPILEMHTCPYPELIENDENRQLCEMEQEMLSQAVGQAVQLDCCRLDGHQHCQFRPVSTNSAQ